METDEPFRLLSSLNSISLQPFDASIVGGLIAVVLLLICSAFISGSEVAFFSLSPSDIEEFKNGRGKRSYKVLNLLKTPDRLLSTILIVNNFVNVGIVILSAYISSQIFDFSASPVMGFILEVVVITFILLLFGEILPKVYATRENVLFASLMPHSSSCPSFCRTSTG